MWSFFFNRVDPHPGHASLTTMAAVGFPACGSVFTDSSTESGHEHYLCSTTARSPFVSNVPNLVLPSALRRLRPTFLRDDPGANVIGALHDPNPRCFNPREKLHRCLTNESDALQIEEDATLLLDVQQFLQPLRMFIVHFST